MVRVGRALRFCLLLTLVVLLTLGALGTSNSDPGRSREWPTRSFDFRRTGYTTLKGYVTSARLKWKFYAYDQVWSTPVVADVDEDGDMEVVVATKGGYLFSVDGKTGEREWVLVEYFYAGDMYTTPTVADSDGDGDPEVLMTWRNAVATAVDGATGNVEWGAGNTETDSPSCSPVVADIDRDGYMEVVVIGYDGKIYSIDGRNGDAEWSYDTGKTSESTPAAADLDGGGYMEVAVGSGDTVFSVDGGTGNLEWTFSPSDNITHNFRTAPVIADIDDDGQREVLALDYVGTVYCLNGKTGALEWSFSSPQGVDHGGVAVADIDNDGDLEAIVVTKDYIHILSGTGSEERRIDLMSSPLWGQAHDGPSIADIDGDGDLEIIVGLEKHEPGENRGAVAAYGPDGTLEWYYIVPKPVWGAPAIADVDNDGQAEVLVGVRTEDEDNYYVYCLDQLQYLNVQVRDPQGSAVDCEVVVSPPGAIVGDGDRRTVNYGEELTVTAMSCSWYRFDHWELDGNNVGSDRSYTVNMTSDHTIRAVYVARYSLSLEVSDSKGNVPPCQVNLNPPNSNYEEGDFVVYDDGTSVTATAQYCSGYRFDRWILDGVNVGSSTSYTVTMDGHHALRAVYVAKYDVTIRVRDVSGSPLGCQVNLTPPNALYGDGDSETFDDGTSVTATAQPCTGYRFDHWELDGVFAGSSPTYLFTVTSGHTLEAVYMPRRELNLEVRDIHDSPIGCQVNLNPPDALYGDGASEIYDNGTSVTATAQDCPGYRFDHWELDGVIVSSEGSYTVTMDSNHTLRAVYVARYSVTVEVRDAHGPIGCQVNLNPPDALYGDGASETYDDGDSVTATAQDCAGYRFDHWELNGAYAGSDSSTSLTMDGHHTLKAVYVQMFEVKVEVRSISGEPLNCKVNLNPPGQDLIDGESRMYEEGTYVLATARPCIGQEFHHWELNGVRVSSSNPYGFVVTSNLTLRAVYLEKPVPTAPLSEGGQTAGRRTVEEEFPSMFRYSASAIDAEFNRDLLEAFAGPAQPGYSGPLVILGGPDAVPYDWGSLGVSFVRRRGYYVSVRVHGTEYFASYGVEDYCVISLGDGGEVVRIAGVTRYGTRAGLMWLLNNPDAFLRGNLILLRWADSDGDGRVELGEIELIAAWW